MWGSKSGMDGCEASWEVVVPRHGERRAADAGKERQQNPQRSHGRSDTDGRKEPLERAGAHGRGKRRRGGRQRRRTDRCEGADRHDRVDQKGEAERDRDRSWDGAGRVEDFFTQRRDPCVPREGKEQESS